MSSFGQIPLAPPNSILGVSIECKNDPVPEKINLTIGAFRTDDGTPYVLPTVHAAEKIIFESNLDHEYLTQDGHQEFNFHAQRLMFGENSPVITEGRVYTMQGLSGTGSLRLIAEFIGHWLPGRICYIPDITWPSHNTILQEAHVPFSTYRYLDSTGCHLDFPSLFSDLESAPPGSIVLFHSCAHNPTGVDPTNEQWKDLFSLCRSHSLLPFFDNAYQGFVSGCVHTDAFAVRLFAHGIENGEGEEGASAEGAAGLDLLVACSFSKNFGLYGERVGAIHIVSSTPPSPSASTLSSIASQLRVLSRSLYSTCPTHGARIVSLILQDPLLKAQWEEECRGMAERILRVRSELKAEVDRQRVVGNWSHLLAQRGMFSFIGIKPSDAERLKREHHVYLLSNGRISMCGLNSSNIPRFAFALGEVLGRNNE